MADFDPRIIRVGVEIRGQVQFYEGLSVTVRGTKTDNPQQDSIEVGIANLSADVRNYLLTETSPFNANRTPKRLIVEAGRRGIGVSRIFSGDITSAAPSQPPDVVLTLKAQTGYYQAGNIVSRSYGPTASLKTIAAGAAKDIGARLLFQAVDKLVSNYAFTGGAIQQIDALANVGGVNAYLNGETLVVKTRNAPLAGRVRLISADTGMVGIPQPTEQGVKVTILYDGYTDIGDRIVVESQLNPALNGPYTVYKMGIDLATRENPFYLTLEGKR